LSAPLIPRRPYLLRAMHQWISDNGQTPHIVVDATVDGVQVPQEHVKEGKIVLNLSYDATRQLEIGNESVEFGARFGGSPRQISVPVAAILGIYARESGQGMIFGSEDTPDPDPQTPTDEGGRPHLRVVK
jgi:stringent starvation protein B